jgi:uncharacterized protein YecE (DUF72 family)
MTIRIGTAGWSIPTTAAHAFPQTGTSLERYATRFDAVEINSSFHRPHRASTWARWHDSVPAGFRFSVKIPKTITHQRKLVDCADLLTAFRTEIAALGDKLAVLLVQLPPSLRFDPAVASAFFDLALDGPGQIACEPRHASWFEPPADAMLANANIARVAADPALSDLAARPGGSRGFSYRRLHGSPQMYRSNYADRIAGIATDLRSDEATAREAWCMFDNTASSAATGDALALRGALGLP